MIEIYKEVGLPEVFAEAFELGDFAALTRSVTPGWRRRAG